jgi:penicillin-binding protein 1C
MRIALPDVSERGREEWFVAGTEPLSRSGAPEYAATRILYPPDRAVIGLDPDIPPEAQRLFFQAAAAKAGSAWRLDGQELEAEGPALSWTPRPGRHRLTLLGSRGETLDAVSFEVRGTARAEETR